MLSWLKNLYIIKLLWGTTETPQKTTIHPNLLVKEKKKPGRRPGIKTNKTSKTVKK